VRRDFLESVDPVNAEHASFLIDGQLVALGRVDLFSVKEPDDEHDAVLSSECGLACDRTVDPLPDPDPLWDWDVNGLKTCNDNQSHGADGGEQTP
jgi:hypothetical protein